jgi:cold-inducible RNA-binding protein
MEVRLYVGNLDKATTEGALRQLFAQWGPVTSVNLIKDHASGLARGFAFVTMGTAAGAQKAMAKSHDISLVGRRLTVNIAEQPRAKAPEGYQSKLSAFSATGRSPKVNTLTRSNPGDGYKSKLSAYGSNSVGPTKPRRRGRDQRH